MKAGCFQLHALTWVGIRTPDIFRYAFHSDARPPAGANRGQYRSAEVDRLIERARAEPDLHDQARWYRELAELSHQDLPVLGLWYEDQVSACRPEIKGYSLAADGHYDGLEHLHWSASG